MEFWHSNGSLNLGQTTKPYNNNKKKKNEKKKRTCTIENFTVPVDHSVELKESEKKDKYLDFTRGLKKTGEYESDIYTNYDWCTWYSDQRIYKRTGECGNEKTSGDHLNYCIIEIGQNTEESPGDLRRLAHSDSNERPSANAGGN